ncbi:MAG TPA: helix-turn-helix transcriptional regulator [Gemmataceae bacterium]|jgi:lambda repressor-like predicted transcriptional regulator
MGTAVQEFEKGGRNKLDGNLMVSQQFAQCLCAFRECSAEVQEVILDMARIVNDPDAIEDEREAAVATIAEALFPCRVNGAPGTDLEDAEHIASQSEAGNRLLKEMDQEEITFAERVTALLKAKGWTQGDLAAEIEVGQSAVSMMLARKCRPQRRTVEKIAKALGVLTADIWPERKA